MAIYLKITNSTEVVKKKTSKWLSDITPERIDRKLVEDEVIKGIIDQLTLEGIKQYYMGVEQESWKLATLTDLYDKLSIALLYLFNVFTIFFC